VSADVLFKVSWLCFAVYYGSSCRQKRYHMTR